MKDNNNIYNDIHSEKLSPQAIELEESILGTILVEQKSLIFIIDILTPEVFYKDIHKRIYSAILSLFSRSEPVDILTITNELKKTGELEKIGGAYFITQLTNRVASTTNIDYYVHVIIEKYLRRELINISSEITKVAYDDTIDIFELLEKTEKQIFDINNKTFKTRYLFHNFPNIYI